MDQDENKNGMVVEEQQDHFRIVMKEENQDLNVSDLDHFNIVIKEEEDPDSDVIDQSASGFQEEDQEPEHQNTESAGSIVQQVSVDELKAVHTTSMSRRAFCDTFTVNTVKHLRGGVGLSVGLLMWLLSSSVCPSLTAQIKPQNHCSLQFNCRLLTGQRLNILYTLNLHKYY